MILNVINVQIILLVKVKCSDAPIIMQSGFVFLLDFGKNLFRVRVLII